MSLHNDHTAEAIRSDGGALTLVDLTAAQMAAGIAHAGSDDENWTRACRIFCDVFDITTGGTLTFYIPTSTPTNVAYNIAAYDNAGNDGDSFDVGLWLLAGTYTFDVYGEKASNRGKLDWTLDGVSIVTGQDWYAAAIAPARLSTGSITVTGDGYHKLTGTINGKNGSSSDYYWGLTYVAFIPASYPARS